VFVAVREGVGGFTLRIVVCTSVVVCFLSSCDGGCGASLSDLRFFLD
jgi:hypothetical protein